VNERTSVEPAPPSSVGGRPSSIRIVLADDHRLVRASLRLLLEGAEGLEVVGEAENGRQAVELALALEPDIVLMDLSMPELDGIQATMQIRSQRPNQRVVVLTSYSDRERVLDALHAGATGYLLKDEDPQGLVRAIDAVMRGESPLDPRVGSVVLEQLAPRPADTELLTEREREVLALVAQGLSNKAIANRLQITTGTVKAHIGRVFQAIGVRDRTSAAVWARKRGYDR
jgi:DNA-binding NarL/FixJ family response regulator